MSKEQKALLIPTPKAPFIVASRSIPSHGEGEVLLKVMAVGLNPLNWLQHEFDVAIIAYPAVIGADIAGVVEEVGEGVKGFVKGDQVFVQALEGGPHYFYDRMRGAVGPFASSPIGLGLNPTFSWDKAHRGESALVIGAGTSTGQFAVQLFKFAGFTRIIAYASKIHFDYLKELGATECIDRAEVPVESLEVKPAENVVYDATFTDALNAAYDSVVEGGKIATVRPEVTSDRDTRGVTLVRVWGFYAGPNVMKPIGDPAQYPAVPEHTVFGKEMIKALPEMLAKGAIVANRVEVIPNGLAGIPAALDRIKARGVSGVKLVAHPQDPTV